ncbi:MAG TPA: heat-inducible transcriptional repressor HrcA [Spongiibacteraceae bacterium]|jgi:heat-inducible transcriptional repressor|nr:heat-inducible transcriptional repressor HrcA [Spongiibacteraceae bacterium]HUH36805.1 heat-inducible transcriptional repressor HrcA [Spongiibacteraceae bacterium]
MAGELISERAQVLLKALVARYIREGQPVGSRTLLEDSGLAVSPATVRNIMADLEERGLIAAPHTSAGRIPTVQGYRLFVDTLVQMRRPDALDWDGLALELNPDQSPKALAGSASRLLADLSAQAGLVTVPRREQQAFRQVEFLPLSDNRVLVILVVDEQDVQNRVIHTSRRYGEAELRQASNLINQRFAGRQLAQIRSSIVTAMRRDKDSIDDLLQSALDLASMAFEPAADNDEPDYLLAGESHLLGSASHSDIDKLRELFEAFQQKKDILELVDRCIRADGVQIFIGEESGYAALGDFSIVTAPYQAEGQTLGVLGVIGPTRMAYDRVIPLVDVTARMLSKALSRR